MVTALVPGQARSGQGIFVEGWEGGRAGVGSDVISMF